MHLRSFVLAVCCVCAGSTLTCARSPENAHAAAAASTPAPAPAPTVKAEDVHIAMRNVRLHVDRGIVLQIRELAGTMVSRTAGQPPVFDDQRSYSSANPRSGDDHRHAEPCGAHEPLRLRLSRARRCRTSPLPLPATAAFSSKGSCTKVSPFRSRPGSRPRSPTRGACGCTSNR